MKLKKIYEILSVITVHYKIFTQESKKNVKIVLTFVGECPINHLTGAVELRAKQSADSYKEE